MVLCSQITLKGTRCSRQAKVGGLCTQHSKISKFVKNPKKVVEKPKRVWKSSQPPPHEPRLYLYPPSANDDYYVDINGKEQPWPTDMASW
jgi:hypothetical protein